MDTSINREDESMNLASMALQNEAPGRLEFLTQATRARVWETDADLVINYMLGDYFDDDLDAPHESTLGLSLLEIFENAEHGPAHQATMELLRARKPIRDYRYSRRRPDGGLVHLVANAEPMFDTEGVFTGYRGVSVNVNAEVRARLDAERDRARFAEALGILPDGFAIYDADGCLTMFNQAYKSFFGDRVELGRTYREIFETSEPRGSSRNGADRGGRQSGTPCSADGSDTAPDAEEQLLDGRWVRNHSLHMNDGGCAELRTDITDLKQREAALRESEERFRRLFSAASVGIIVTDTTGRFWDVNPAFFRMIGRSREDTMEMRFIDLLHPDDRARSVEERERLLSGKSRELKMERRILSADGNTVWVRSSAAVVSDAAGEPAYVVSVCEDISEVHRNQVKLRERDSLLAIAGQTARLGGFRIDPDYRVTYSQEALDVNGLGQGHRIPLADLLKLVRRKDREGLRRDIELCMTEGVPYVREIEFRSGDRESKTLRTAAVPIRDAAGNIVHAQGSIQDITEYRDALNRAKDLAERLDNVMESTNEGFLGLDRRGIVTYCNRAYEDISGSARADTLGQEIWNLFPADRDTDLEHAIRRAMKSPEPVTQRAFSNTLK
ncbi:MAG: PAS domain S-box protein, partial [Alphaproteobacteria bacterium]|nr:PAS domain S-box protein [Alphaproteobacteria bacterium]